jgi:hypothetical protein
LTYIDTNGKVSKIINMPKEKNLLIKISEADSLFANDQLSRRVVSLKLKTVVVQETGKDTQLLVHMPNGSVPNNAMAVLNYMQSQNIEKIRINGGAHVLINSTEKTITVSATSLAFGEICKEEYKALLQEIFPDYEIIFDPRWVKNYKPADKDILNDGKICDLNQISEEVEKG